MIEPIGQLSDQQLVALHKRGNTKAEEALYKRFYGYAMGISLRYCFTRDDALESVNDAFIKLFNSFKTFDENKQLKPWFRQIIVNTAIDNRRKNIKTQSTLDIENVAEISVNENIIDKISANDILQFLSQLAEIQRVIFNLYEIDGYNHEEISVLLNIPSSSSRVYLSRAKDRLRQLIKAHFFLDYERAI